MERKFRKEFKELLENTIIPGNVSQEEREEKMNHLLDFVIPHIPKKLFRFRACQPYNIEALRQDCISLVKPSAFSDLYDTNIYIDNERINNLFHNSLKPETLLSFINYVQRHKDVPPQFLQIYNRKLGDDLVRSILSLKKKDIPHFLELTNNIDVNSIYALAERNKKEAKSMVKERALVKVACFTEDVKSITMWDRYADGHKGYALEYNFSEYITSPCTVCANRCNNFSFSHLLPIIYTRTRPDTSEFVNYLCTLEMSALSNSKNTVPFPDSLFWIKSYLYKHTDYSKEEEWRFMTYCDSSKRDEKFINLKVQKPIAIYYGTRITPEDKESLHKIAAEKKIKEYNMYMDDDKPEFKLGYTLIKTASHSL